MTTAEQKGCYTHILFLFQILCYYFAHENRNYPFCSTCLFCQADIRNPLRYLLITE